MKAARWFFEDLYGNFLPGVTNASYKAAHGTEVARYANEVWRTNGDDNYIGTKGITLNEAENAQYSLVATAITDYVNSMVPKFIMGTEVLTEESFQAFVKQINALGLPQAQAAQQSAYDRYVARVEAAKAE